MTKEILKSIKTLVLAIGLPVFGWAQPALVDGVAAVIGDEIVLKSEVDAQHQSFVLQGGDIAKISKCRVFEDMLFEKLLIHHAEIDSIAVSEEEVESNMDRRLDQLVYQIGSKEKLEEYYKKSMIEIKEEMRPFMRNQLTAQRMQGHITANVEVTPSEIQEYFDGLPQDSLPLINTEVEVAQIIKYPEVSPEAEQDAIDKLNGLKQRIEGGTSFSTMAILYSEDPGSAKNGGEYKGIKRGQFVKEFEAVAFNLQVGEISEPFKSEFGYHIVQVQVKRGEELDLRHILIKPKISDANLREAQAFLDSLRRSINDGLITFKEAAKEFSDDKDTRYNSGTLVNLNTGDTKWEISQLDRSIYVTIETLEKGEVSKASFFRQQDGKEGYRLVKLLDKIEPHKANLRDDYTKIQSFALSRKQAKAMEDWIQEKLKETYVKVNNEYFECTFENDWLKDNATN
ncbi:MAG: peptidylprolyl isomerase [Schleiferiaceae bacterium]